MQKEVAQYDILKRYLTIYLATVAIPNYKKQRIEAYVRAMGRMADAEVRNAENTYDCWNNFQKTILSYNIKYWEGERVLLGQWGLEERHQRKHALTEWEERVLEWVHKREKMRKSVI